MEIFILTNPLICRHKINACCLENFNVFQSVHIPWSGGFTDECYGQTVLFLNKEETPHAKWRL